MRSFVLAFVAVAGFVACAPDNAPRAFGSVAFDSLSVTLVTGDTLIAPATVRDDRGRQLIVPVAYESADTTIVTVNGSGRIVAVAPGATRITATSEAHSVDLPLTVVRPTVRQVGLAADTASLVVDQSLTLVPTVTDVRGRTVQLPLTYSSSDSAVATVDPDGRLTAQGLGTATITVRADTASTAFRLQVLAQFSAMTAGDLETCGITTRGTTYCWGAVAVGRQVAECPELGLPCTRTPVEMDNGRRYTAISAGDMHVCALDANGAAYCWGNNWHGQLGNGTTADAVAPQPVLGGLRFASITAGRFHTCAIATTGDSYCWGDDDVGELGAGTVAAESCMGDPCATQPAKVVGGESFVALAASDRATCGRTAAGSLYCWGLEVGGADFCSAAIGDGCTRTPLLQSGGTAYSDFVMGDVHKCGQLADGSLECWGANYFGEFGNGTEMNFSTTPVPAAGGMKFVRIVSSRTGVCGRTADSAAYCWGQNPFNAATGGSDSANVLSPARVGGTMDFIGVWSGSAGTTTCGVASDGRSYCWGDGRFGQLGDGSMQTSLTPKRVAPLP